MKTKKTIQVAILATLSLMGLLLAFSCTKLTQPASLSKKPNVAVNTEFETLVTEINLITNHQITYNGLNTRAPWWKYLITAAADAVGALVPGGSIGTGISASSLAWNIMKGDGGSKATATSINFSNNQDNQLLKGSAGHIHNQVIKRAYLNNGEEDFFELDEEIQLKILHSYTKEVMKEYGYRENPQNTDIQKAIQISKAVVDKLIPEMSVQEYADALKHINPSQDFHYGVDIIASVVSGLERSSSGEKEYIEAITNAIANSAIKASLKNNLIDAVSIAYASSILWNTSSFINPIQS